MISPYALIQKFKYALEQKWGYIYGSSGQLWTQELQNATKNSMAKKYGSRWIGHIVTDCSGLFVWAYSQLGASIYHGSNTIWKEHLSAKGPIEHSKKSNGEELKPGTAVFLTEGTDRHHIGLYIGNNKCIEAKGTLYGVVESDISHWDEWGELKMVDYSNTEEMIGAQDEEPLYRAYVTASEGKTVRMRSNPSLNAKELCLVPIGTNIEVLDILDGWSKVSYQGKVGYMMTKFLKTIPSGVTDTNVGNNQQKTHLTKENLLALKALMLPMMNEIEEILARGDAE